MADPSNGPMLSEVSICNQALGYLGANPITSFADQSTTAELCRNNYPYIRDAVLEECMWSFATVRATSTTADRDDWGQAYKHAVPLDWLKVLRCYTNVSSNDPSEWIQSCGWRREGRFILAEDDNLYMLGVKRVTDTGMFNSMFVQALATRLAAEMAVPITENLKMYETYWILYNKKIMDAESRDGAEARSERIRARTLVRAR
jgi:hypothetical protein